MLYTIYRKGEAGDWKNHMNDKVRSIFYAVTDDLIKVLDYD